MEKAHKRRKNRYTEFKIFSDIALEVFEKITEADPRHTYWKKQFYFHVKGGGRCGGQDPRIFDVYYGERPVQAIQENFPSSNKRLLVESGAQLSYRQYENGKIGCYLHSAETENMSPIESVIIVHLSINPRVLTEYKTLEKHWQFLSSYMEVTNLDGEPTLRDHLTVWWLRWTRVLVIDENAQQIRVWKSIRQIVGFSFTVGLSGFLLILIQNMSNN